MALFGRDKDLAKNLLTAVTGQDNFHSAFPAYLAFKDRLKAQRKQFNSADLEAWVQACQHLLDLSVNGYFDKTAAGQLSENILFCAIHAMEAHDDEVQQLIRQLCRLMVNNRLQNEFQVYIASRLAPKYPAITVLLYSIIAPEAQRTLAYYKSLWESPAHREAIYRYAVPNLAQVLPAALGEPGYSRYRHLLEWIRAVFTGGDLKVAAMLISGLWQGRYTVQKPDSLDEEFFGYFAGQDSPLADEMAFAIACMTRKVNKMTSLVRTREHLQAPWSGQYRDLLFAFVESQDDRYPEIDAGTVLPPNEQHYPRPLYAFMIMVYGTYASRYQHVNTEAIYEKVTGPWRMWVDQFGAKQFPYQVKPDLEKYEKLIHEEMTSPENKQFIAAWIVELMYYREGLEVAAEKLRTYRTELQAAARQRLNALQGNGETAPDRHEPRENDTICDIRRAIVHRDAAQLRQLMDSPGVQLLHPNEAKLCQIALKCLQRDPLLPDDVAEARTLGERGLPTALFLVAQRYYGDNNFGEACSLLEAACSQAPAMINWKSFWAQALANLRKIDRALEVLSPESPHWPPEAQLLFAWCAVVKVFPGKMALLNFAFNSGQQIAEEDRALLMRARRMRQGGDTSLDNLLDDICEQLEDPSALPRHKDYPDFAAEWEQVRFALLRQEVKLLLADLEAIRLWKKPYQEEVVERIAETYLARMAPDAEFDQSLLEQLLKILGKSREDFYAEQLAKDVLAGRPVGDVYRQYQPIFSETHPIFKRVALYKAFSEKDAVAVLQLLESAEEERAFPNHHLMTFVAHSRQENWGEALTALGQYYRAEGEVRQYPSLIRLAVQIGMIIDHPLLPEFLQLAQTRQVDLQELPPVFKTHFLRRAINAREGTSGGKHGDLWMALLDPPAQALLKVLTSQIEVLIPQLPTLNATGAWGMFIYQRTMRVLVEALKSSETPEGQSELAAAAPALLAFIERNQLAIDDRELAPLNLLSKAAEGTEACRKALGGILQLDAVDDLVQLSKSLCRQLNFPEKLEDFLERARVYVQEEPARRLERLKHLTSVLSCWLEYLHDQNVIRVQIYEPLLKLLTEMRMVLFCHQDFPDWFLEQRKKLPEAQQYLNEAKEYLQLSLYQWVLSLYTDELNHFFVLNKTPIAKLYGDSMQVIAENLSGMLAAAAPDSEVFNAEAVELTTDLFKTGLEDWIRDKKGNLESQMPPKEEDKLHYAFDYQKGLEIIKRILEVFPTHKELFILGLYYANLWNKDHENFVDEPHLSLTADHPVAQQIRNVIRDYSNFFADKLIPMCKAGQQNEHLQENMAITRHFYYKALVENQDKPYNNIEQVLKWDSAHEDIFHFYRNRLINKFNNDQLSASEALAWSKRMREVFQNNPKLKAKLDEDIDNLGG